MRLSLGTVLSTDLPNMDHQTRQMHQQDATDRRAVHTAVIQCHPMSHGGNERRGHDTMTLDRRWDEERYGVT